MEKTKILIAYGTRYGELEGKPMSQKVYFGMSIIMVIPIVMVVLTMTLDYAMNKWLNIIVAIFFILFNLVGLKGYKAYDKFLLIVSLVFNILTILYAWTRLPF